MSILTNILLIIAVLLLVLDLNKRYNIFRKIIWFYQRGRHGWADCDVWNFDYYLADIIIAGVRRLRGGLSCPSELLGKDYFDLKDKKEKRLREDKAHEEWEQILEDIAQGFEAFKELGLKTVWYKRLKDGRQKLDLERERILYKKVKKGLQLFAEWYMALWD